MISGPSQSGGSWSEFLTGRNQLPPPRVDPGETVVMHPDERPDQVHSPQHPAEQVPVRPALIGRFTVALAGLLAAGCLLLGLTLLVLVIVVPGTGGAGIGSSSGPGWTRAGWHVGVGLLAEVGLGLTQRRAWPLRVSVATGVIVAVLAVLALAWWA